MKRYFSTLLCLCLGTLPLSAAAQQTESTPEPQAHTVQEEQTSDVTASSEETDDENSAEGNTDMPPVPSRSDHVRKVAPWPEDKTLKATLHTSLGDIQCNLFAGAHPLTVINFKALAEGKPAWKDASNHDHAQPYYQKLPFGTRVKGRYVTTAFRPEGTGFVIADERCQSHPPVAGSIAMVQKYPGQAAAQFMLLASDIDVFKGMYAVFGQCEPIDTIQKLTENDATLHKVTFEK